mgnify:CR=1 FL=1
MSVFVILAGSPSIQIVRQAIKNRPPVKKGGHKMIPGAWLIAIMNGGLVRLGLREHYSIFDGLPAWSLRRQRCSGSAIFHYHP